MHKPLRIDFLTSSMEAGGAQRVISILANYLADKGYSVRIITFWGPDHYELNDTIERVRLHKHPLFHSIIFNGFFNLMSFYRKKSNRPDILSSHMDLLGLVSIPNSLIYNIKVIVSEHNNHLAYNNRAQSFCWNYLYPKADMVTILTEFDKEHFL
ncbi:glycosyltransferase family 4 protein, partial [Flavobacteriaceae bacterium TP-CH-4]